MGLHDTCGIHNLHGMPSILGALISVAIPYVFPQVSAFEPMTQLRGIVLTLLFASVAGVITGGLMARLADRTEMASDAHYWEVADDFGKVSDQDALDVYLKTYERSSYASKAPGHSGGHSGGSTPAGGSEVGRATRPMRPHAGGHSGGHSGGHAAGNGHGLAA